ncbi:MAG: hypothetical protein ACRDAU_11700 [Clostridium sp.]
MRIRKYINNKYFNNIDYHELVAVNKKLSSNGRVIERIISITVISNLINWKFNKKNKIIIETEVEYKILYLTKNDSRIYLVKGISYFYNEIAIPNFINGMNIEVLIRKGLVDIGSNIQDTVIIKDRGDEIYLSAILMNWVYIKKIPRILLNIEMESDNQYLYSTDEHINEVKQLTFEGSKKFSNIVFSSEGDEIFYIYKKDDRCIGIFKLNIVTKQINKIMENTKIVQFKVFNKDKLVYEEKSNVGTSLCMINIHTLKSIYLIKEINGDIDEIGCNRNSIYFSMNDGIQSKTIFLNGNGEITNTLLGEYKNIIFIEKTSSFFGMQEKNIYRVNLKSKNSKEVKLNNINIIDYKYLSESSLIIKGQENGVYQLIILNMDTLEQNIIFQISNEIGVYTIESENEIIISYKDDMKWILRRINLLKGDENLGEIEGNAINMIVRGE